MISTFKNSGKTYCIKTSDRIISISSFFNCVIKESNSVSLSVSISYNDIFCKCFLLLLI